MSVDHKAVAFYGVYFASFDDVNEFLEELGVTECDEELRKNALGYECLDAFSGNNWILGIKMELGVPIAHYESLWAKLLPANNKVPEAILEVKKY